MWSMFMQHTRTNEDTAAIPDTDVENMSKKWKLLYTMHNIIKTPTYTVKIQECFFQPNWAVIHGCVKQFLFSQRKHIST